MAVRCCDKLILMFFLALICLAVGPAGSVGPGFGPGRALADDETAAKAGDTKNEPRIITVTPRGAYANAVVEARLGHHKQALELLDQLPGLVPENLADDVAWRRAESLIALGRRQEAVEQLKLCLKLSPQGPRARACRSRLQELGVQEGEG